MGNNKIYETVILVEMVRLVVIPDRDPHGCCKAGLVHIRGSAGRAESDPGTT